MSEGSAPILSVVVPVRNERDSIRPCLESILADAPPGGIEVLVVDGMSDDGTAEEARRIAARDRRVRVVENPSRFVPQAMNLGITAARAPFIGRIDGHCLVEPGYFRGCLERLGDGAYDCVGGVLINEGESSTGRAIAAATSSPVGVGSARFRTGRGGEAEVDTLAFGVYRRDVFDRIGTFDERFVRNQDDELNLRLTRAGGRILLVPRLRIRYRVRGSIRMLWRQYHQYGYWKWEVLRKHGRLASPRHAAPSAFLVAVAGAALGATVSAAGRIALGVLLIPYLGICTAEAIRQRALRGAPVGPTFAALVTLHLSYGSGLLRAMADSLVGRGAPSRAPTSLSR